MNIIILLIKIDDFENFPYDISAMYNDMLLISI